jgi:glucose dehydrogenase
MARIHKIATAALLAVAFSVPALANEDLIKLEKDAKQWVSPTGNYANQRYSELSQINKDNVGKLQVAWTMSTGVLRGHEGNPLVIGDDVRPHAVPEQGDGARSQQ